MTLRSPPLFTGFFVRRGRRKEAPIETHCGHGRHTKASSGKIAQQEVTF